MYNYSDKFWNKYFKTIGIAITIAMIISAIYEFFK